MQRRKYLIGLGSLAAGGAAATGTSAFTAVQADRGVTVDVVSDSDAFLGIEAVDTERASTNGDGQVTLNFEDGYNGNDYGLNPDARTFFVDVLRITNQGADACYVAVDDSQIDGEEDGTGLQGIKRMTVYMKNGSPDSTAGGARPSGETRIDYTQEEGGNAPLDFSVTPPEVNRKDENAKLSPGESALLSFVFVTNDNPPTGSDLADKTINIGAAVPPAENSAVPEETGDGDQSSGS